MKKTVIISICVLLSLTRGIAQVTPEVLIKQCPDLPSVAVLAASYWNDEAARKTTDAFVTKIDALIVSVKNEIRLKQEAIDAAGEVDANRIALQMTGHSAAELENMSEEEEETFAQEMLASVGLGNLKVSDFEEKSEAEILAAILSNTSSIANSPQVKKQQAQAPDTKGRAEMFIEAQAAIAEVQAITDHWHELTLLNNKEVSEATDKIAQIWENYQQQIDAVPQSDRSGETGAMHTPAEWSKVESLMKSRISECYTIVRAQITKELGSIKAMFADVKRYEEAMAKSLAAQGMTESAKITTPMGLELAERYLRTALSVTNLPGY